LILIFNFTLKIKAKLIITLNFKVIIEKIMAKKFRSSCLIASALDLIGDKWSLLIIRDMLLNKKKTFKEMAASDEGVATNLLSTRLKLLESLGVITKRKLPANKKENIYLLTQKGIDLAPMILEIVVWSDKYVRDYNPNMNEYESQNINKAVVIEATQKEYKAFVQKTIG
jgi:DNA-binding HxlR family transcriptional regulator